VPSRRRISLSQTVIFAFSICAFLQTMKLQVLEGALNYRTCGQCVRNEAPFSSSAVRAFYGARQKPLGMS
jgi:hypothetical protein